MVVMSRRGLPVLSWQFGCKVPEKVPEKTPGAWLTKLSMMAPGFRDLPEAVGLVFLVLQSPSVQEEAAMLWPLVDVLAPCERKDPAVTDGGRAGLKQVVGGAGGAGAGMAIAGWQAAMWLQFEAATACL